MYAVYKNLQIFWIENRVFHKKIVKICCVFQGVESKNVYSDAFIHMASG